MLLTVWLGVIFSFSAQGGDKSGGLSRTITEGVLNIIKPLDREAVFETVHFLIRKGAHFTEYAVLGSLWSNVFSTYPRLNRHLLPTAASASVISAALDEFHQSFVRGRVPAVTDVLIDSVGGLTGVLITMALIYRSNKKAEK